MRAASFCALAAMFLSGCYSQMFDPDEKLPVYPGIHSELHVLQGIAAASHGPINPPDDHVDELVILYQTIENNTEHDFIVLRSPAFQVEPLVVRDSDGDRVPLSEYSAQVKQSGLRRPDPGGTTLFAGQSIELAYHLSILFEISKLGVYTAAVETRIIMDHGGGIGNYNYYKTNPDPVTFEVE